MKNEIRNALISLTLILVDALIVIISLLTALIVRFDGIVGEQYLWPILNYLPAMLFVRISTFYCFGLYHRLWRYASINELLAIVGAVTMSSLIIVLGFCFIGFSYPRSIYFLSWFFNIVFIGASRLFIRIVRHLRQKRRNNRFKVLIVGAGDAGAMIAREIHHRYYETKELRGFIDDDPYKQNKRLFGVRVLGGHNDIQRIVSKYGIQEIIIAMPSVNGATLRKIVHSCRKTHCEVKAVPGLYELINGKATVQQIRNIDFEDLLRREPVKLDLDQISSYLSGKRVLVTGAGGSIGSELCRQIARVGPDKLILLGRGENSIYEIERELRQKFKALSIEPVIADIRDQDRINSIFGRIKPQVVFHAAAHKHVPLMESQPEEAVRNNIFGTKNVAEAADRAGAEIFIMISTDKAVNPTSAMGATKRVAELVVESINKISKTRFAAVRFGNVLGSRGSVVPLFKKQIANGGPVTVTHPEMRRYFMTIPEASQLVLQAGAMTRGGEVFVLDMGSPVKIVDLASDMIELSGLTPNQDISIEFTGLRPGEKMFEELLTPEEGTSATKHSKIFVANLRSVDEAVLAEGLLALRWAKYSEEITKTFTRLIPTYQARTVKQIQTIVTTKTDVDVEKKVAIDCFQTMPSV